MRTIGIDIGSALDKQLSNFVVLCKNQTSVQIVLQLLIDLRFEIASINALSLLWLPTSGSIPFSIRISQHHRDLRGGTIIFTCFSLLTNFTTRFFVKIKNETNHSKWP